MNITLQQLKTKARASKAEVRVLGDGTYEVVSLDDPDAVPYVCTEDGDLTKILDALETLIAFKAKWNEPPLDE